MATIRARKQADGSTRYTAIVRIRRGKVIVYQEYKTFVLRAAKSAKGLPVRPEVVQEARGACGELRLTGKARKHSATDASGTQPAARLLCAP